MEEMGGYMDVSNVMNFKSEWLRRYDNDLTKDGDHKWQPIETAFEHINQTMIDDLQKWSDENPPKGTRRKEKFVEVLRENGFGNVVDIYVNYGTDFSKGCVTCINMGSNCDECRNWWNEIIEDNN